VQRRSCATGSASASSSGFYITTAPGPGTAIVGTTAGASVYSRGGIQLEATNSHKDWFQLNQVAIVCERRLALACFRARGFIEVRLA
jgi:hypothetical protein